MLRGGFRGCGRLPLRDSTTCQPKESPFGIFQEIDFWPTDPKIFLKAPLVPIYANFEWAARAEKTQFLDQNFPKIAKKKAFFRSKQGLFIALGELGKSI